MKANHNIIFLKNRFKIKNKKGKVQENVINAPRICPYCGEKEELKKINTYYGINNNYFLKIWVCKRHDLLNRRYAVKPFLIAITPAIIPLILIILFPRFSSLYIIIFCCSEGVILPSIFRAYRNFWIIFFKNESVIYIRGNDWCEEFLQYNEEISSRFSGDLTPYEKIKGKSRKFKFISIIIIIVSAITFIISLGLNWKPLLASSGLFFAIYALVFALVDFWLYKKAEKLKKEIFFGPHE